jgi:uncharacterized protein (TIGR02118 family)
MNTFKVVRMAKRGDAMPAEFRQEWLERHKELKRTANRVVASVSTGEVALGGQEPPFDGMVALYYTSAEAARATLLDDPKKIEVVCEEQVMSQKPDADKLIKSSGQLKVVRTVFRRKDLTQIQFKDYWLLNHAKLEERVIAQSPVLRIVAIFALPAEKGGNEPAFDGMVELYFSSVEEIRAMFAGPIPATMRKDEENFVQMDAPAVRLIAEEFVL